MIETSSVTVNADVTVTTFQDPNAPISQKDSATANHDSNPLAPTLNKFAVLETVTLLDPFFRISTAANLRLIVAPSLGTVNSVGKLKVRLNNHKITNIAFHPLVLSLNPPLCLVNSVRGRCSYSATAQFL